MGDDALEKSPGVDTTRETIFMNAEYTRDFLWRTYFYMYTGLPFAFATLDGKMNQCSFEALADCWHSHMGWDECARSYYVNAYSSSMENWSTHTRFDYDGEGCWEAIRAGWNFIDGIQMTPDMDDEEKARLVAEAKVIIASRYFDMYRHYGGLPLVKEYLTLDSNYEFGRATLMETHDFMIQLLDEAADDLPWVLSELDYATWDGRFTRASAMALKCKILLFTASPLFNSDEGFYGGTTEAETQQLVWTGGFKQELWDDLKTACDEFFAAVESEGYYGLLQSSGNESVAVTEVTNGYRVAFRDAYTLRGSGYDNPEILISTRRHQTSLGTFLTYSIPGGAYTPTLEYFEMFPMSTGAPFEWTVDPSTNMVTDFDVKMFSSRDPRLYETMLVEGAQYQGNPAEMYIGGKHMMQYSETESGIYASGFGCYKYALDGQVNYGRKKFWPYLRMAEVYLIYAEALIKCSSPDVAKAIEQIDMVRARVGLRGLEVSNPTVTYTADNLLPEILRERACELGLEDVRLFDLCRNKMAENFTTPLHGIKLRKDDDDNYTVEKFEFTTQTRSMWAEGYVFNPKWYLTAFGSDEVNKGYGIIQNPGW